QQAAAIKTKPKMPGARPGTLIFRNSEEDRTSLSAPASALQALALQAHCNTHATADAECGESLLGVALLHFVQQRHKDAGARRTDRVTDRDRTAVDVDLGGIPAEVLVDGTGLRRKRFVGFDEIKVGGLPAG